MPLPVEPLRNLSDSIIGLPDQCQIVRRVQVDDNLGSWYWGEEVVATEPCRLSSVSATEQRLHGQYVEQASAKIVMRHTAIVDAEDRIRITTRDGETWEVTGVPPKSESMKTSTKAFVRRES